MVIKSYVRQRDSLCNGTSNICFGSTFESKKRSNKLLFIINLFFFNDDDDDNDGEGDGR